MTTIQHVIQHVMPAAYALLPYGMNSPEATAMLLAIGLQESKFVHRAQVRGPAKGWWQFEKNGGVLGVLSHPASSHHARRVCETLRYTPTEEACYVAIEHNDILACCFARLLLWTFPRALPETAASGWFHYTEIWRPGKPHAEVWNENFVLAWSMVDPDRFRNA